MFRLLQAGLLVAMFAGAPLFAQTFGQIEGSVTDSSGATIAGAKITITNAATGVPREVESNEAGNYSVPFLNPGIYSITAELEGFKTARVDGRQVQVGDRQQVVVGRVGMPVREREDCIVSMGARLRSQCRDGRIVGPCVDPRVGEEEDRVVVQRAVGADVP